MIEKVFYNVIECKLNWLNNIDDTHGMPILFNRKTGDMRVVHTIAKETPEVRANWKRLEIRAKKKRKAELYITDVEGHPIKASEVERFAWQIADQTMKALNGLLDTYKKAHFENLSQPLDRIQVEHLLSDKKKGTYLITEADLAINEVARRLSETNDLVVVGYLLSILTQEDQVAQYMIIASKKGLTLFTDEPNLSSKKYHYYKDIESLLSKIKPKEKSPL